MSGAMMKHRHLLFLLLFSGLLIFIRCGSTAPPVQSQPQVVVTVDAAAVIRQVEPGLILGANLGCWVSNTKLGAPTQALFRDLRPSVARFPGGNLSRDEPSARHSPVAYIHGRVRRKWTPGQSPGPRPPWSRAGSAARCRAQPSRASTSADFLLWQNQLKVFRRFAEPVGQSVRPAPAGRGRFKTWGGSVPRSTMSMHRAASARYRMIGRYCGSGVGATSKNA